MSTVSVIIPTHNAGNFFRKLLESIKKQTLKKLELLVIDSSSRDNTTEIAKEFGATVITIPQREFDHGGTRTFAGKLAKGDILVYLTQDVLLADSETLEKVISPLCNNPKIGATFGRQIPYPETNLFGKHLRYFNYPEISYTRSYRDRDKYGIKAAFISNSFSAYKRDVLEEIGWFKNNLIMGEDIYAGAKILKHGYQIAYVAEAKVFHSHSYTIWLEFKRYFDIGVFHREENWILEEFGKAEKEGMRYVKSELAFLKNLKAYHLIPISFIRNIAKYFGYKLGYHYDKIPFQVIKKLSLHSSWWDKAKGGKW